MDETETESQETAEQAAAAASAMAEVTEELARVKDQLLRALAEQENVRRRAQRDRDEAVKFAASNFAKDLITSADNLRRALDSVKEEDLTDERARTLLAGVAATERGLLATFERHGIRKVDPLGEKFDHNLHQALFEVEHTGKPAGTVVQVLASGFTLNDRLLRAAMVGVAKGDVAGRSDHATPYEAESSGSGGSRRVDTTV